jgi:hypothetical protein
MFTTASPVFIYIHAYNDDSANSYLELFVSATPQLSSFHPCYLSVYSSAPSLAYSPDVELLGMCAVLTFSYALHEAFPDNVLVVVRCVCVNVCASSRHYV